jgi:spore maturation protein CgeB
MNILILTYEYRGDTTAVPAYPDFIKKHNPDTWIIFYKELYEKYGYAGIQKYLLDFAAKKNIQVILYFESMSFGLHIDFFRKIGKDRLMILYVGDDCYFYDVHLKYVAQGFDLVFTNIIFAEYKYRELGIDSYFIVPAFDASLYCPHPLRRDIDVSFIGGFHSVLPQRKRYINFLLENGVKVETWGINTVNGTVSTEKKIDIYNRSKINLDFSGLGSKTFLTRGQEIHRIKKHPKGRVLEIALTKSFLLAENAPGYEHYLEPGKEIAVFNGETDLLEKIKYYLAHPQEREKIAHNAYTRAIKKNNLDKQCEELLNIIREEYDKISKTGKRELPLFIGKEYKKNFSFYRINRFMKFMTLKKYSFAFEELRLWFKSPSFDYLQLLYYLNENFPSLRKMRKKIQAYFAKS